MKFLLHLKCDRCGHTWSVACGSMSGALSVLGQSGCPKNCGLSGKITLIGQEDAEELAARQAVDLGLGAMCLY